MSDEVPEGADRVLHLPRKRQPLPQQTSTTLTQRTEETLDVRRQAHLLSPRRVLEYALSDFDVSIFNFASAQAKLNQKNARLIRIPLPPPEEQRRIVDYLNALKVKIKPLIELQYGSQKELDAILPAILDRVFQGEL